MEFVPENKDKKNGQKLLDTFWERQMTSIANMTSADYRNSDIPLARIRKIMKLDEDVKMVGAETVFLFAKAAEMFVAELTLRAYISSCENDRRTLQKSDISSTVSKFDQFDFLIDIVPREEKTKTTKTKAINPMITGGVTDANQILYQLGMPGQSFQIVGPNPSNSFSYSSGQPYLQLNNSTTGNSGESMLSSVVYNDPSSASSSVYPSFVPSNGHAQAATPMIINSCANTAQASRPMIINSCANTTQFLPSLIAPPPVATAKSNMLVHAVKSRHKP